MCKCYPALPARVRTDSADETASADALHLDNPICNRLPDALQPNSLHLNGWIMPDPLEDLTFVLTVALEETGRPGCDLDRAKILLDSCAKFVIPVCRGKFLIVTRPQDLDRLQRDLDSYQRRLEISFLDETKVCPLLDFNPDTSNEWPERNLGWYRQQLIKLATHAHVDTSFYMTLDADIIFTKPLSFDRLFSGDRAIVNAESAEDYMSVYNIETAKHEVSVKSNRYLDAERVLQLRRCPENENRFYGETPVILSKAIVEGLILRLEQLYREPWPQALLRRLPWTEYPLYFLFAERRGLLQTYHIVGGPDSILSLSQSLWWDSKRYRDGRSLESWQVDRVFDPSSPGVAVAVQSYLGYDVAEVRAKVDPFLVR